MNVKSTPFEGLLIVEPKKFGDQRGYFYEMFNAKSFSDAGLPVNFLQDNISRSGRGTVRGLHFQKAPHGQGKLVRVLEGSVFDVAVDIRPTSKNFGKWFGLELSEENALGLYVPAGFA